MVYHAPYCRAWALSLHSSLGRASSYQLLLFFEAQIFWIFLHAPQFCLGTFDDWEFSFMPPVLLGHFQTLRFFFFCYVSRTCPPVWGVILTNVIYLKKSIRLKRGLQMIYFSLVNGLSKNCLSSSQTHALWIGKLCFHASMPSDYSFK
jgi:hypothetical protein